MDKNKGYKAYNKFVSELLVDESIREEVIEKTREKNKQKEKIRKKNNLFNQE